MSLVNLNSGSFYISTEDLLFYHRVSLQSHSTDYFPPGTLGLKMREEILSGIFHRSSGSPAHNGTSAAIGGRHEGQLGAFNESFNGTVLYDDAMGPSGGLDLGLLLKNIIYIITGVCVSALTFFGNVLVVIAFITDRKLHRFSNYYIISLACADMIIGLVSIPLFTVYMVTVGVGWPLGHFVCNLWLQLDYALCYTSLLSIFLICIDRYWSVSNSVHYLNNFTKQKALTSILPTWVLPQVLFFLLVWLYPYFVPGTPPVPESDCYVPYQENVTLNVAIAVMSFWVPLFIIIALYIQIYRVAKRLSKRNERQTKLKVIRNLETKSKAKTKTTTTLPLIRIREATVCEKNHPTPTPTTTAAGSSPKVGKRRIRENRTLQGGARAEKEEPTCVNQNGGAPVHLNIKQDSPKQSITVIGPTTTYAERSANSSQHQDQKSAKRNWHAALNRLKESQEFRLILTVSQQSSEKDESGAKGGKHIKALKMLSSILACYVICWAPFSCFVMVIAKCPTCIPLWAYNISYGLCYINSTINPFCYAYANIDFRRVVVQLIRRVVCCEKHNPNSSSRLIR
ncbi:muscarinic acetylcholine receptor M3-like [Symsagittifera roscoffensis]|uniref:muscarinic acetylcholine receptor M3-like n=1 Tax=Symsagittifera roscoffensis TaxID=84072 RepID=UPI00307C1AAD